jgi:hypothetical protein
MNQRVEVAKLPASVRSGEMKLGAMEMTLIIKENGSFLSLYIALHRSEFLQFLKFST